MPNTVEPIVATSSVHLSTLIGEHIDRFGPHCDLNHIDVSGITNMDNVFARSAFNGRIDRWDTGRVSSAIQMFADSEFDGDISRWNMDSLRFANKMFENAKFSGDISSWTFAKPGPGNLDKAFYSEHFRSDMPLLKTFGCEESALHPSYAGSFRDEYTLAMASNLFLRTKSVHAYLARTAPRGLNRLHVEYLFHLHEHIELGVFKNEKPSWCPLDIFERLREERKIGLALDMDEVDIAALAYQRMKFNTPTDVCIEPGALFAQE